VAFSSFIAETTQTSADVGYGLFAFSQGRHAVFPLRQRGVEWRLTRREQRAAPHLAAAASWPRAVQPALRPAARERSNVRAEAAVAPARAGGLTSRWQPRDGASGA